MIVAGHSTRRPGFKFRTVNEGFVVDDVFIAHIFPSPLSFQQLYVVINLSSTGAI